MKKLLLLFVLACWVAPSMSGADTKTDVSLPVIGAVENLLVVKEKLYFPARIDTGAKTSSLSAVGIQPFERDGKRWVRFQVKDTATGHLVEMKRPLERMVKIKRHGELSAERPVVSLLVAIGNIKQKSEFSLVDRTDYEYPALVGRNFLNGKAVVDVSQEYIIHPLSHK